MYEYIEYFDKMYKFVLMEVWSSYKGLKFQLAKFYKVFEKFIRNIDGISVGSKIRDIFCDLLLYINVFFSFVWVRKLEVILLGVLGLWFFLRLQVRVVVEIVICRYDRDLRVVFRKKVYFYDCLLQILFFGYLFFFLGGNSFFILE